MHVTGLVLHGGHVSDLLLCGSCSATRLQPLSFSAGQASGKSLYGRSGLLWCTHILSHRYVRTTSSGVTSAGCHSFALLAASAVPECTHAGCQEQLVLHSLA